MRSKHSDPVSQRLQERAQRTLAGQERRGLFVAASVRTALCAAVFLWQIADFPFAGAAYIYGLAVPGLFIVLGLAHMAAAQKGHNPVLWAGLLYAVDIVCMAYFFTTINPYLGIDAQLYMSLRWDNMHWYFVLLAQSAMALNWRLVAWCGLLASTARLGQLWAILQFSDAFSEGAINIHDPAAVLKAYQDAAYVSIGQRWGEVLAILGVTAGLIAVVLRSNRLVMRHAAAERGRAALARYFSPNTVDALLLNDEAWRRPKRQRLAVMFLDIVGFTRMCAGKPPEYAVGILKGYHERIVGPIFAHEGTLDKYIGDGVMVTFGTPYEAEKPASQAYRCARAIQDEIFKWNEERLRSGEPEVKVGIGIHIGEAVIGDIGDSRRLEFAVIGDVVNRASRLEKLTRQLNADIVVSGAIREAMGKEGAQFNELVPMGAHEIAGLDEPLHVWGCKRLQPKEEAQ